MRHPSPAKRLIVCSTRDAFLQRLLTELGQETETHQQAALDLLAPTLSNLHNSRNLNVAFCPDLTNLHAYLAALTHRSRLKPDLLSAYASAEARPLLMIMNPIQMHEPTSSFSAQGFNRSFAAAVETAHHLGSQLIMVECTNLPDEYENIIQEDEDMLDTDRPTANPWDQDVSMLNITTKTFGTGDRGWVGRTVKIGQVARRWCAFRRIEDVELNIS